ncbi:hypothetical protein EYC80_006686 [Monilinia laxa]|uniref:Uncharacterized protein n=1 Tax=Monilinia laxa TaxID=61186 RepID=A0A5N6JYV7_MONLA|nr:hypothetical protein EYC80_006686 [Monilinia laxa]
MPDYPGLGLPLRHLPQHGDKQYPVGAHGGCWGAESNMLPVREPAMMNIMDKLMDKEEWHRKIFDEAIVSKWREEALAIPDENFCKLAIRDKLQFWNYRDQVTLRDDGIPDNLELLAGVVSEGSFDYCVKELRSKAKYYEETSIIPTLDACASIPKSDNLVSTDLHNSLRNAFDMLKADQSSKQDWDPNSNEMVQDLVNPSMFPLVYGTTRVLKDELVGVDDAIEKWAGKGNRRAVSENVAKEFWSDTYQWLPTNVAFQDDGRVKFTSYISNLHPTKFPEIYRTIEKLIETSIPLWDQCIAFTAGYDKKYGAGRVTSRFPWPDNPDDENEENWIPSVPLRYKKVANKEVNQAKKGDGQKHENRDEDDINIEGIEDEEHYNEAESYHVWEQSRRPAIPELSFQDIEYAQEPEKCLSEKFRDSGLQVIVKMASIELTPENPEFPIGSWHIEGQNE